MYATDEACLEAILKIRYGASDICPYCNKKSCISKVKNRRCYQCSACKKQFYPTAGTVFDKTRVPLSDILFVLYLFITTRNGVAAKEIQRQLGVSYECAWKLGHRIRILIGAGGTDIMTGVTEIDETLIGGVAGNMHADRKKKVKGDGWMSNKTVVLGMLERGVGVRAVVVNASSANRDNLYPIIRKNIKKNTNIVTDSAKYYDEIESEYKRESVNHMAKQYVREKDIHTNTIEGFWSQVKRTIGGTHIQVSRKYLQLYVNECAFRYNNVFKGEKMFDTILSHLPIVERQSKRR